MRQSLALLLAVGFTLLSSLVDVSGSSFSGLPSLDELPVNYVRDTKLAPRCEDGRYRVDKAPFDSCAGFRDCETGHYCTGGVKLPCPPGSYGNSSRLNSSTCSGPCPAGYYCPAGTADGYSHTCSEYNVISHRALYYCPTGSGMPLLAEPGYYTTNDGIVSEFENESSGVSFPGGSVVGSSIASEIRRTNVSLCEFGHTCNLGVRNACPGGTFGNSMGLSLPNCSGLCPGGFFCPIGSIFPTTHVCSSTKSFCPEGSASPQQVPLGSYGIDKNTEDLGGFTAWLPCPKGSFCVDGEKFFCPGGTFGDTVRLYSPECSGACNAGWFCPFGSVTRFQRQCNDTNSYCPTGSPEPIAVTLGHYTYSHAAERPSETVIDANAYVHTILSNNPSPFGYAQVAQLICPLGYYCLEDGIQRKCPGGRYGATLGLSTSQCTSFCDLGYYCPEASISPREHECGGSDVFCPPGSAAPQRVHEGYYSVQGDTDTTRGAERKCEPGWFCTNGVKELCDKGHWGGEYGASMSNCSGRCNPGYYCPLGSMQPNEVSCGSNNKYCPRGSIKPITVTEGFYTVGGNDSTRVSQLIAPIGWFAEDGQRYRCPQGHFGAVPGLSNPTCSGICNIPGFYCPIGSNSPKKHRCGGDDVICPIGTSAPINVYDGFYTADYTYEECPPGRWRNLSIPFAKLVNESRKHPDTQYGANTPPCILCPEGTYKTTVGNELSLCLPCDDTTWYHLSAENRTACQCDAAMAGNGYVNYFDISEGEGRCKIITDTAFALLDDSAWGEGMAMSRFEQKPCEPGHWCRGGQRFRCSEGTYGAFERETRPECSGLCASGYFCLQASVSPYSYPCGSNLTGTFEPTALVCPEGSGWPTRVPKGYYSNENADRFLRSTYEICPTGYYCPGDGKRYKCLAGTYSDVEGAFLKECSGCCLRGYYCEEGSSLNNQYKCGNSTVFCPTCSAEPTPITSGFRGLHTGVDAGALDISDTKNETFSAEVPSSAGYYAISGIMYPCPPASYGWRVGVNQSACDGLCARGFYCTSYLAKNPIAPAHTVWNAKPHIYAWELPCGQGAAYPAAFFCPEGSIYPTEAQIGFYTGGNDALTRYNETICEAGNYCESGTKYPCPRGRYGEIAGISAATCTDPCPAAFFCPEGTAKPIPCGPSSYSTGNSFECTQCPSYKDPMACQNSADCCGQAT